jgi:hypothetical protein
MRSKVGMVEISANEILVRPRGVFFPIPYSVRTTKEKPETYPPTRRIPYKSFECKEGRALIQIAGRGPTCFHSNYKQCRAQPVIFPTEGRSSALASS